MNEQEQLERELGEQIDAILDLMERATAAEVELDPLATIVERLQARGETMNLEEAPPLLRMLLGGMLG